MIPLRFFWFVDAIAMLVAFLVAYWVVPVAFPLFISENFLSLAWVVALSPPVDWNAELPPFKSLVWIYFAMVPPTMFALSAFGNHAAPMEQSRLRICIGTLLAVIVGLSIVTLIVFAVRNSEWSRLFLFSFAAFSVLCLALARFGLHRYQMWRQRAGYYVKGLLLVGNPRDLEPLANAVLGKMEYAENRLVGYIALNPGPELSGAEEHKNELKLLGFIEDAASLLVKTPVNEVVAVYPLEGGTWLPELVRLCRYLGIKLHVLNAGLLQEQRSFAVSSKPDTATWPAVIYQPPNTGDEEAIFAKRVMDMVVSAALLVALAPLFGMIALSIKLTTPRADVFYRWRVVGQNGVPFTSYKFTTMVDDADSLKADLLAKNEMQGPAFKMKHDPRVTPLGSFLRKFSLNELPQLWSVLKGDMSIVGPRPPLPHEHERYEFWHNRKLSVRPGITCLWQVRGRNKITDFNDWVRMDLEYIENWSLWLDVKILFRTVWVVLAGSGS